ncbi:MAG: hypothetical protein J6M58_02930 [Clostridium sp.]|nr:hypothetical protein [Clostridium sp.]
MNNNKRLVLSIFWIVLGITLMILSIAEVLDDSVYSGMGGALTAVGALQLMRNLKYRRDPEYREKIDTELSDERNRFLQMKSWSWAGYIAVMVQAVASVAAYFMGQRTVQLVLWYSICLLVLAYWVSWMILSRKY